MVTQLAKNFPEIETESLLTFSKEETAELGLS
jgi:hypothetical protein